MATPIQFVNTPASMVDGMVGAPGFNAVKWYSAATLQTLAVITTAGAFAELYATGIYNEFDVFSINYDMDGTPGSGLFQVSTASSGSLVAYNITPSSTLVLANGGAIRTSTGVGNTFSLGAYDTDGLSYLSMMTLTAGTTPAADLHTSVTIGSAYVYRAGGTDIPVTDGGTGASSAPAAATNLGLGTASNVQFLNVSAGTSGAAGTVRSYPSAATTGYLGLTGVANSGDYAVVLSNRAHGQATTYSIADVGAATGSILNTAVAADPASNLIRRDITVAYTDLATAGSKVLYASSGSKQYKLRHIQINGVGGTDFSGGGGDRLLSITDNTSVYALVPAASLQTLVNSKWGDAACPAPASTGWQTSTAAGASLVAKYSGGSADYTAGSVVISIELERVA